MSTAGLRAVAATLALFVIAGCASVAPDYVREQRLANEIVPLIVVGEGGDAGDRRRPQIPWHTHPGRQAACRGGPGARRRRASRISASSGSFRAGLADRGYTTLSIQMPVLVLGCRRERLSGPVRGGGRAHRRIAGLPALEGIDPGRPSVSHKHGCAHGQRFPRAPARHPAHRVGAGGDLERPVRIAFGGALSDTRHLCREGFRRRAAGRAGRAKLLRGLKGVRQAMVYGTDHYFGRKERKWPR